MLYGRLIHGQPEHVVIRLDVILGMPGAAEREAAFMEKQYADVGFETA